MRTCFRFRREAFHLVPGLVMTVLVGGGCTAAGLAAGPLFTSLQVLSDRSVERALPADLPSTWAATVQALGRLDVQVKEANRSGETWTLKGSGETVALHAELRRVTPRMTRLSMTVEAGKLLADKRTAEEIMNQVASLLAGPPASASPTLLPEPDSQKESLSSLQEEIRRLGAKIEEREALRSRADEGHKASRPAMTTVPGILEVPISYGVPTVPAPGETTLGVSPQSPTSTEAARPPHGAQAPGQALEESSQARSLNPVGTLTPVESQTGPRGGR